MVEYYVHDQAHAASVYFGQQCVKVFHGSVPGRDGVIVADIVAVVAVGAGIERGEPDNVNAEVF